MPELLSVPSEIIGFVASQINVESEQLGSYGGREQTRSDHQRQFEKYLGYRSATQEDLQLATGWLTERSLEHDRPILLLQQLLCEHLQSERIVRPGLTILEKIVGAARDKAEQEIYRLLTPLLDEIRTLELDKLLKPLLGRLFVSLTAIPVVGDTVMRLRTYVIMKAVLAGGVSDPKSISPPLMKEMYVVGNRRGHYRGFINLLRNSSSRERGNINVPTFMIWGAEDWSRPEERRYDESLISGVQSVTVQAGGHFLPLDAPNDVVRHTRSAALTGA